MTDFHPRDNDPLPNGHPPDCNCPVCELIYGSTDPEVIAHERNVQEALKRAGLKGPVGAAIEALKKARERRKTPKTQA